MISISVYVTSVIKEDHKIVVEASNGGSEELPPFIRFELPSREQNNCHIGKRYDITIRDGV